MHDHDGVLTITGSTAQHAGQHVGIGMAHHFVVHPVLSVGRHGHDDLHRRFRRFLAGRRGQVHGQLAVAVVGGGDHQEDEDHQQQVDERDEVDFRLFTPDGTPKVQCRPPIPLITSTRRSDCCSISTRKSSTRLRKPR